LVLEPVREAVVPAAGPAVAEDVAEGARTIIVVTAVALAEVTADIGLSVAEAAAVVEPTTLTTIVNPVAEAVTVLICIVQPLFATTVSAKVLMELRAEMPLNVNTHVVMAVVSRKARAFIERNIETLRRILTTTVRSGQF
jgi:hypothetical protein